MKNIDALDLQVAVDELQESIKILAEQHNAQYTDLVTRIDELKDGLSDIKDEIDGLRQNLEEIDALEEHSTFSVNDDELYEQAKNIVIASGKASTSWLQRKLGIGYSRSAQLVDRLEREGVVGPANGSKARENYTKK